MRSNSQRVTTIDLLRHGRTVNDDIFRGRIDTPLAEEGFQQMQDSLASMRSVNAPWHKIISSPLQRCRVFAEALALELQRPLEANTGFIEMDFGDWDGRPFNEVKAEFPELSEKVWSEPDKYGPPNGETFTGFCQRIESHWHQLIAENQGQHLLLVCHGGVIRVLLRYVMQAPISALSRFEVPYASFSRVKIYHQAGSEDLPQLVVHRPSFSQ